MYLRNLSLINFKNIEQATLRFSPSINVLVGENGAGKTTVLDSVHYLAIARSMMAMSDRQSIRHGESFFVVDGTMVGDDGFERAISCTFGTRAGRIAKSMKCDGKEYERLSDHVGVVPIVVVAPQDVSLVYEGAEERRRFLNSFISQLDPLYLNNLIRYNAILGQRNALLKQGGADSMLDIYDEQLSLVGEDIHRRRHQVITTMQPLVESYYLTLSGEREGVWLDYESALSTSSMAELLKQSRLKERQCEYTTVGIHRDDISFKVDGYPLRRYGSQGQQKSFLVALKLAQYNILSSQRGQSPILLLDDLFDKLDSGRVQRLLSIVGGEEFGQIFITDCNRMRLEQALTNCGKPYHIYCVDSGAIEGSTTEQPSKQEGEES